jgi:hypothetical protein
MTFYNIWNEPDDGLLKPKHVVLRDKLIKRMIYKSD